MGFENLSFGVLVASILAPRGTIEESRGTLKGDVGFQVGIGITNLGFWNRTLKAFGALSTNMCILFHNCF